MDYSWVLQGITTIAVGLIAYLLRDLKKTFEDKVQKNSTDIEAVKKDLNDLKADLPFVYVMREDFIRAMANVEVKLDKIYELLTKGGASHGQEQGRG